MKGVDISNQLISYYELDFKTYKWYKRIFMHLIDISIVNPYILFKKCSSNKMNLDYFRLYLVKNIIQKYDISIIDKKIITYKDMHLLIKTHERHPCLICALK